MASLKTNKQDSPQIISLTRSRKSRSRWAKGTAQGFINWATNVHETSWEGDNQNNSKRDLNVSSKQSLLNLPNFVIYRGNQRLTMYTYQVMPNFSKYFFKSNKCENVIKNFSNNRDTKQKLHIWRKQSLQWLYKRILHIIIFYPFHVLFIVCYAAA